MGLLERCRLSPLLGVPAIVLLASLFLGCGGATTPDPAKNPSVEAAPSGPLFVTIVGEQPVEAALDREWAARSDSALESRVVEPAEAIADARLNSDLVLFPAGMLGELAQAEALLPLDEDLSQRDAFDQGELLRLSRQYDGAWGGRVLAMPLGCALPVLVYRTDVFEKHGLSPPTTWAEYDAVAKRLRELHASSELPGDVTRLVGEPTAAEDAARQLLVRAAAYVRVPGRYSGVFDYSSMKPELSSPAFVRALDEYRSAVAESETPADPEDVDDYADLSKKALAGDIAMGIVYLVGRPTLDSDDAVRRATLVGVATVPGAVEMYQPRDGVWASREAPAIVPVWGDFGLLAGIGRSVQDRPRAVRALQTIVGAEVGSPISFAAPGTAPFRQSQLAAVARWTGLPPAIPANAAYAKALEAYQSSDDYLLVPRVPGRERYLAALGAEVGRALKGEKTSDQALADATVAWEKITDELGREAQTAAYRASLGLEAGRTSE